MKRLIGVGVGPGDPELVTVKAVRVLREADVVLVPVMDTGETGRAEATVRHHLGDDPRIQRAVFALNDRGGLTARRTAAWRQAAEAVRDAFAAGGTTVAFATIGDPNVYSTFTYLARTVRDLVSPVTVETIPGITAMQDLAARSGTVLVEGDEVLTLVPVPRAVDRLLDMLDNEDTTVVAYKCGGRMPEVLEALAEGDRLDGAVYGAALGLPGEDVRPAAELDADQPVAYLSTVIAPAYRPTRGGKL
jgi:precorrin-2/cobalt-factor-2 C20-methyltransferase